MCNYSTSRISKDSVPDYSTRVSEDLFTIYLLAELICGSMHDLSTNRVSEELKIQ